MRTFIERAKEDRMVGVTVGDFSIMFLEIVCFCLTLLYIVSCLVAVVSTMPIYFHDMRERERESPKRTSNK